ncbi:MAG: tetratricopeptide repeat protein [Spirochaetia bacterium]|nr:tetratricopeptide repeat protein [Spirochaetia bacterium]
MKKVFSIIFALLMAAASFSYDFTLKVTPMAMFPFLSAGEKKYDVAGYGGFVDVGMSFFDFLNVGPEFGFILLPKYNAKALEAGNEPNVYIVPLGVQLGVFYYPFSRIEVAAGIAGGAYGSFTNGRSHYAPWYRAYADLNFRINTRISAGLDFSWFNCQNNTWFGNPGAAGITAGLVVNFKFSTEKASGLVDAQIECDENVFPLIYSIYKTNAIGTITISNSETAEIRNVKVKFRAEGYTASEMECGTIKMLRKNRSEQIPFYADFSDKILRFSESGKVSGEIVIEYELLGDKRVSVVPVTVSVYNRNSMRWVDSSILSSYVSTNAPEILELSKFFVGVARNHFRTGLNKNMQFAMYVYEGIRSLGIVCEEKSDTPYNSTHLDFTLLDYIQYPYQTLSYRSGDKDDIGILFMSMLESVGIGAAYIPLEDDFIVAIELGDNEQALLNLFNNTDNLLVVNDKIWMPLSMSVIHKDFAESWKRGVQKVSEALDSDADVDFIILSDAWQTYPPSGFSSGETTSKIPSEKDLVKAGEDDLAKYITQEFGPQIAAVQERIKTEGASISLYNRLGLLYVRAGMYDNAVSVYEISAKMGSVPAMNNLGNILSLQKKYAKAKEWYEKVLVIDPQNETARKNLDRIETELEQ